MNGLGYLICTSLWLKHIKGGFFFKFCCRYASILFLFEWWLSPSLTINTNDSKWKTFSCGYLAVSTLFYFLISFHKLLRNLSFTDLANPSKLYFKIMLRLKCEQHRMLKTGSKSLLKPVIFRYSVIIVQHNSTCHYSAETMQRLHVSSNQQ